MMPINLSIKNVPDHIAEQLRQRAVNNHRSLQGELLAILEETVKKQKRLTPLELIAELRASGLRTGAESTQIVRAERDGC